MSKLCTYISPIYDELIVAYLTGLSAFGKKGITQPVFFLNLSGDFDIDNAVIDIYFSLGRSLLILSWHRSK
jgi:hypothetical protein